MGLVVSVLHLPPGSSVHAALVTDGLQRQYANPAWHAPQGVLPKGPSKHPRTWLVLSDQHAQLDELLHEVHAALGAARRTRWGTHGRTAADRWVLDDLTIARRLPGRCRWGGATRRSRCAVAWAEPAKLAPPCWWGCQDVARTNRYTPM